MSACESCASLTVNGVLVHEAGCPDAWKVDRECKWCGTMFMPKHKAERCCSDECANCFYH